MRFLAPAFLQMGFFQAHYLVSEGFFELGFEFEKIIAIFYWLSAIVYSKELLLPVLINTESCDSSHRSQLGVTNIWVFSRNSGKPFNTGSRYSPYCLIWRVMTPRIVFSKKSLTTVGSHFLKQFWRTTPACNLFSQGVGHIGHALLWKQITEQNFNCSLSLWRVVRGSKLMHLELIHGLFIT